MATNRLQSSTPQCVWSTWEWWWWWSLLLQQCHVIHQALMMVIRNQFGTTVESCQSIMFNLIHMQKEKKEVHIVWKITPNWLEFLSSKMTCLVPLIDRNLQVFKNSPKWNILVIFYLLFSTQNVNVARFVGNVEWDFWVIFKHREVEKILYFKKPRVVGSENKRSKLGFSSPQKYN